MISYILYKPIKLKAMERYLLTIEFRYSDAPTELTEFTSHTKKVTIGVYDEFDEAAKNGNLLLENLESKFDLHKFPDGTKAKKDRFSKYGGCFGTKNNLISNLAYLKTPFQFYAKITTLKYDNIDEVINEVVSACKRYKNYKS